MAAERGDNVLRIVMLGKTGMGKSSTGNTLLDRPAFRVAKGLSSGTEKCQWADAEIGDMVLQVTDTPGLSDTHKKQEDVLKEVGKSIAVVSPGPHIILMVFRCDSRFTPEEYTAYETLKQMFGDEVKKHMIIVFVGMDTFGDTIGEQRRGLKEEMDSASGTLRDVLDDARHRYFGMNNKASKEDRKRLAEELISMMKDLKAQRGGTYYQSDLSNKVNERYEPLVKSRMNQGGQGQNMSREEAVRATNQAIVDETESVGFFTWVLSILKEDVLPAMKKGLEVAKEGLKVAKAAVVAEVMQCSVM